MARKPNSPTGGKSQPRKPIGKRARFDVFKRDNFTCQYCGSHPPAVVLEVDHIVAVANGGDNSTGNLITACFNCNRGKAANPLTVIPQSLADKAADVAEREAQIAGYAAVMAARRERIEDDVWAAFAHWRGQDSVRTDKFLSMQRFIERLGLEEVLSAIDIAMAKGYRGRAEFKYFCGICWKRIRSAEVGD